MSQTPLFQPSGGAMVPSTAVRDPRLDPRQDDDFEAMIPDERGTLRKHSVRVLDVAIRGDTIRIYAEFFWPGGRDAERETLVLWQWWELFGVVAPPIELHRMGERWLVLPLLLLLQQWIVPDGQGAERRRDLCWGPLARPTHQVLLYPRIAFEGPGRSTGTTDMREYALYVWGRQPDGGWCPPGPTVLRRLNWATGELL